MMHIVQPDFNIYVGVKDGEVVSTDWEEMLDHEHTKSVPMIKKSMIKYLRKALKSIHQMPTQ